MPESLDDCFNVSEIPCTFVKKKNYNNNKDMELNRCGIVQWKECNKIINLWLDVLTHEAFLDLFPKGVPIRHLLFGSDTPGWETGREVGAQPSAEFSYLREWDKCTQRSEKLGRLPGGGIGQTLWP